MTKKENKNDDGTLFDKSDHYEDREEPATTSGRNKIKSN